RPVLLVGGGVVSSDAAPELLTLAEMMRSPVTTTLMALGAFPSDHPLSMGMLGMHGSYWANMAVHDSDCLVAIGVRFDDRVTGRIDGFAPGAAIIHIDVDPSSISKNVNVDIPIVGDARIVTTKLLKELAALNNGGSARVASVEAWLTQISEWRREHPLVYE